MVKNKEQCGQSGEKYEQQKGVAKVDSNANSTATRQTKVNAPFRPYNPPQLPVQNIKTNNKYKGAAWSVNVGKNSGVTKGPTTQPGNGEYKKVKENGENNTLSFPGRGGARPKEPVRPDTGTDGGAAGGVCVSPNNNSTNSNNSEKDSYAKIVTKNGWKTPAPPNKRKRIVSGQIPRIEGLVQKVNHDVYVSGLATAGFKNPEDMEESVKFYCRERGVDANFTRVMTNSYGSETVGCRVNVKAADYFIILNNNFWPNNVEAREWYQKGRERKPSRTFHSYRDDAM